MTIGLPISLSFQSSNVLPDEQTLDDLLNNCQAPIFSKGLLVQSDEWVYEYTSDTSFTPKTWNIDDANNGVYDLDEVLFVSCSETDSNMVGFAGKLIKITGKDGADVTKGERPKEPEEYDAWDEGVDSSTYENRYMRVSNASNEGWMTRMWFSPSGNRWYYMFWESRGFGGCSDGAWRWSAKDLNHLPPRNIEDYLRTCLIDSYSTSFDASKDHMAVVVNWGSPSIAKEPTLQFKSMIERNGYFYFRTTVDYPIEYREFIDGNYDYSYMEVVSPADIEGFVQKYRTNTHAPFDGKNYTQAKIYTDKTNGYARWTMLSTEDYDSIAFGHVLCDSIDIKVMDTDGNIIDEIYNYTVDNSISVDSDIDYKTTTILYTKSLMDSETVIEVTLHGNYVEIGEIIGAKKIDAGFTKTAFKNKFKDFSPKEQDQWGNWYYVDGIRAHVHSGTVEFKVLRYDELARLMMLIGGRKVIINGSDSTNNSVPDGEHIFASTMLIGRFTSFELDSSEKNKRIGDIAKYTFALEELV